jgi:hypothetical protein
VIEAEVGRDLMYSGLDQRAQMKVAEAIAEAIDKNNRRIQSNWPIRGSRRLCRA